MKNFNKIKTNRKKPKLTEKILNHLMVNGKKHTSEKILKRGLKAIQKSSKKNPTTTLKWALNNSTSIFKIKILRNKRTKKKNC